MKSHLQEICNVGNTIHKRKLDEFGQLTMTHSA